MHESQTTLLSDIPTARLIDLWVARWGHDWVDLLEVLEDKFFEDAYTRMRREGLELEDVVASETYQVIEFGDGDITALRDGETELNWRDCTRPNQKLQPLPFYEDTAA